MIRSSRVRLVVRLTAAAALFGAWPRLAHAQELPLKRPALTPVSVACPVFPTPATPVRQQIDEANRLATLGQESSLEGDHRAARDLFKQATAIDPREASLAYHLAREDEELGDRSDAAREYCRYLALAPHANDAPQIAATAAQLLPRDVVTRGDDVIVAFRNGVTDFDARDWDDASTAFGNAAAQDTALTAAVYNRGVAEDRSGRRASAVRSYVRYLRLDPSAADADQVRARVDALRASVPSPGAAFAWGLLPGGGQFYTGQPVLGVVVVAGVAGGVALALQSRTVTRDTTYTAPFGGTYPGTYTQTQHPDLAIGAGVAGGVLLLGALEAELVAHSRSATMNAAAADTRTALLPHIGPVTVELPTPVRAADGLRWNWPLRIAVR